METLVLPFQKIHDNWLHFNQKKRTKRRYAGIYLQSQPVSKKVGSNSRRYISAMC